MDVNSADFNFLKLELSNLKLTQPFTLRGISIILKIGDLLELNRFISVSIMSQLI